jgi:hypothetical protein
LLHKLEIYWTCSQYRLDHQNTTFSIDDNQRFITEFLDEISKKEKELRTLVVENKALRERLESSSILPAIENQNFLHCLVRNILSRKKSMYSYRYNDYLKDIATYLFILGGRQTYELLRDNLGLPSYSTVSGRLSKIKDIEEGELQIDLVKKVMKDKKLPPR